jgi:glutamine amidotransferase
MAREVTLVDANLGNLDSVERALVQVGATVIVSDDPNVVATSRMVVFPGQGAFSATTDEIIDGAMGAALCMVIERGDPFLGICLGMQLLYESSEENGGHRGLGTLPGHSVRFPTGKNVTVLGTTRPMKIPHVGWNNVNQAHEHYYYAHSYYVSTPRTEDVMWTTTYGPVEFPAVIRRGNILGCQFHPEKSQRAGLRFLRSFVLGGRS